MMTIRRAEARRRVRSATQDTWLTFDPDNGTDPFRRGFRALEALNEDTPLPGMNLHPHGVTDLDIVTYVREGAVLHQEGAGKPALLQAGEFQRKGMIARIRHRIFNGSLLNPAHVFQSCITTDGTEFDPVTEQKRFPVVDREGVLRLVASEDGEDGSLRLHQDVRMYSSVLLVGTHLIHELRKGRGAWLHVIKGRVELRDQFLGTGDAAAMEDGGAVAFTAKVPSEILLFNLA